MPRTPARRKSSTPTAPRKGKGAARVATSKKVRASPVSAPSGAPKGGKLASGDGSGTTEI
jgi:hypothetical protein